MSKNFCFTEYNLEQKFELNNDIRYIIYQKEQCPTTGNIHYQGFIQLSKQERISWLKNNISPTAHFEKCRGTELQNIEYCSKDNTRIEDPVILGQYLTQGARMDIGEVAEKIRTKRPRSEYEDTSTYIMYKNRLEDYAQSKEKHRSKKPYVTWLYGPPCCGKSYYAELRHTKEDIHIQSESIDGFWNDYNNQPAVIIDEFRPQDHTYSKLLKVLGNSQMTVSIKGGYKKFNSPYIYITSPLDPETWYKNSNDDVKQLLRRINKIIKKDKPYTGIIPCEQEAPLLSSLVENVLGLESTIIS